jgi:outer membrane lipopolysaccharide assembly protein LptE/RlpB
MRFLIWFALFFLVGCGYHLPESSDIWLGGDERVLYVQLFENETVEPYLENFITEALVEEFSRSRLVELTEDPESADLQLTGQVTRFKSSVLAYSSTDDITDYRATMSAKVKLTKVNSDETVWKTSLSKSEEYQAEVDKNFQLEGERIAAREVSKRLAEDIYARLMNNF